MQPDLATLAFIAQHTSNAVVITDREGRITWVNSSFSQITGYALDEVLGRKPGPLLQGPGTDPAAVARISAALRAGGGFQEELLNYRKDGSSFWNAIDCSPITDASGALSSFIAIQSDRSERRLQEEALRQRAEALRLLVSAMPLIIFATDHHGRPTLVEGVGPERLGIPALAAHGAGSMEQRELAAMVRRALSGESFIANLVAGASIFELRFSPMHTASGTIGGALGVALDVTEQMQATAELVRARDAAEAATRAKSAFLATMSHEIRTPLNAVIGMADLLLDTPMSEEQRRYAETVRTSGDMLLAVINDILDFSKIEAGNMDLERHPFNLRALVAEVIELLAPRAAAKGLRLAAAVDIGVPPRMIGDPTRIRQILVNLVGNAVKFTARGEVLVRAHTLARTGSAIELELAVSDTGIGIPHDRLARLFHPFSQVDASTTRRYGGTGLGLAICKRLCELMGGTIGARSEPGAGSTFSVMIPVEVASSDPPASSPQREPLAERPPLRILLAEDNSVNQQVALRMLRYLGYSADLADDGLEALRACHARPYDVVLMDVQMPELDGLEATRRLRASLPPERQPYIIAMTANAMAGDRDDCLAAGMNDYLCKPVQRADLAEALRRVPPPAAQARPIDTVIIERLRADFGPTFAEDLDALVAAYRGQLHDDLGTMRAALTLGDRARISALAHRLKGASLTLGACQAATLSRQLEHSASQPEEAVAALLKALEQAGETAARALDRIVAEG